MITSRQITDWKDLQKQTALILAECGFTVEIEKNIATPRGNVEVDVFAVEEIAGRKYQIICECKNWQAAIPQTVIHAFRTTVMETGTNIGYIIASNGFQSGSFSAAELTNIKLTTWQEFQEAFEESWLERFFSETIKEQLGPLLTYTEPLLPVWFNRLSEEDKQLYLTLNEKYMLLGWFIMSLTPYPRMLQKQPFPKLPLVESQSKLADILPEEIMNVTGYRELMELCVKYGQEVVKEFRGIRSTVVKD